MKFIVKREHIGDRHYKEGDIRDADKTAVLHLIKSGVLDEYKNKDAKDAADAEADAKAQAEADAKAASEEKKEPEHKDKSLKASPKNKGE